MAKPNTCVYGGRKVTVEELSAMTGISQKKLKYRLGAGYTPEQAVEMGPEANPGKKYLWNGRMLSITEIAREHGVHPGRLHERLHRGWTLEEAVTIPAGTTTRQTLIAQNRAILDGIAAITKGMEPNESMRCRAAIDILRKIMGEDPRKSDFRCTIPMIEYMFDGDIIRYTVRYEGRNTARLTAVYKDHGFASSLNRLFRIDGDHAREISTEKKRTGGTTR